MRTVTNGTKRWGTEWTIAAPACAQLLTNRRDGDDVDFDYRPLLTALVAEVAQECCAPKSAEGPVSRLAEGDEPICGQPARWGVLTAWTCSKHRRERDKNEIGGPALRAALAAIDRG